jgi:hypothetical protein
MSYRGKRFWNHQSAGIIFFLQNFVYDYTVKMAIYDYTVKMSSRNIFFSPVQPNFSSRFRIKIIFRKKNIKLKLNSLRGKLIKKNMQDQNGSPIYQQKNEIKLVIRKSILKKKIWLDRRKKYIPT